MSTISELDIECENCGERFVGTVWGAVHASEDPELKELLLGGELNMVMCPRCAKVTFRPRFVLYQDPTAELIAYVYPIEQQPEAVTLHAMMLKGFKDAQEIYEKDKQIYYEPVLIFGLEALVAMLREEEVRAEQSQIAQEICKEEKLTYALLTPSVARELLTMRVIPLGGSQTVLSRDSALAGLDKLLLINPLLDLYADLKKRILADPSFKFPTPKSA